MHEKLQASSYIKYLGLHIDEYLDWSLFINHLSHKLVKANAMICRLCYYVNEATIKLIYYAFFHSHLSYLCPAWGQNLIPKHCIYLPQKKAMGIVSFACYDVHTVPLFMKLNIINFSDLILLSNCLFILKHCISKSPSVFSHVLDLASDTYEQNTRFASHDLLTEPTCNTYCTGFSCFCYSIMDFFPKRDSSNNLRQISYSQLSQFLQPNLCLKICKWFLCLRYFINI